MPSAEKVSKLETKLEVIQPVEQKAPESLQKENLDNNGNGEKNSLPPIQQIVQIIQNKIRNLEKRKVSSTFLLKLLSQTQKICEIFYFLYLQQTWRSKKI